MWIIRTLFHTAVIVPIAAGYYYGAAAYSLIILALYVKTLKYQSQLDSLADRIGKNSATYADILKVRNRLKLLTFLK